MIVALRSYSVYIIRITSILRQPLVIPLQHPINSLVYKWVARVLGIIISIKSIKHLIACRSIYACRILIKIIVYAIYNLLVSQINAMILQRTMAKEVHPFSVVFYREYAIVILIIYSSILAQYIKAELEIRALIPLLLSIAHIEHTQQHSPHHHNSLYYPFLHFPLILTFYFAIFILTHIHLGISRHRNTSTAYRQSITFTSLPLSIAFTISSATSLAFSCSG